MKQVLELKEPCRFWTNTLVEGIDLDTLEVQSFREDTILLGLADQGGVVFHRSDLGLLIEILVEQHTQRLSPKELQQFNLKVLGNEPNV